MNESLTKKMEHKIKEFMVLFDQKLYSISNLPCEVADLRAALIKEESKEYLEADVHSKEELDAIVDLLYVTIGTNLCMGIRVDPYFSGQLYNPKQEAKIVNLLMAPVKSVTQDLDSKFPCEKIQYRYLNEIIRACFDIAAIHGYSLDGAFDRVHNANTLLKLWTKEELPTNDPSLTVALAPKMNLYIVKNSKGKVVKPPSFVPPNLSVYVP